MEFTFLFLRIFALDLLYGSPVLVFLLLLIGLLGHRIGRIEGWSLGDAMYHAFINATTVGYGDLRPTHRRSKGLAVALALVGLIFTGMIVAIALHAANYAFVEVHDLSDFQDRVTG